MELLCIAHDAEPRGSVLINGRAPSPKKLADVLGTTSEREIVKLLAELEREGVFSRDPDDTIYSRRMRRDEEASETGREHIAKRWGGGNGATSRPPESYPPPNSPPNRVANSKPNGVGHSPPTARPITPEADSESEAKAKKERESNYLLKDSVPPPEADDAPSQAEIEARRSADKAQLLDAGYCGAVVLALGKELRRPAYAAGWSPKRTVDEQTRVVRPPGPKPNHLKGDQLALARRMARARLQPSVVSL